MRTLVLLLATLLVLGLQQYCQQQQAEDAARPGAAPAASSRAARDDKRQRRRPGKKARKADTSKAASPAGASGERDKPASEPAGEPGGERDEPAGEHVRVATWNLKRLGHGKKRLDRVAAIIDDFDVIALQEVMTPDGVAELLAHLPGWDAALSTEPVGRGAYTEWYAVLYRKDRVRVERSFLVKDGGDELAREPFVTCLRSGTFDFCLVSIHVIFGDSARARDDEISALGRMVEGLRRREREKDWIVAGDFNRMPGAPGWDFLLAAGFAFTSEGRLATSLGKKGYHNAYDHILVDRAHTGELDGWCSRVDFVSRACQGDFAACSREVSDHAPVVARFRVTGPDDD